MKKENPVAKQRPQPDPDHLGDQPVAPMSPDELLEFEEGVIHHPDVEDPPAASDEPKEPNSEDQ